MGLSARRTLSLRCQFVWKKSKINRVYLILSYLILVQNSFRTYCRNGQQFSSRTGAQFHNRTLCNVCKSYMRKNNAHRTRTRMESFCLNLYKTWRNKFEKTIGILILSRWNYINVIRINNSTLSISTDDPRCIVRNFFCLAPFSRNPPPPLTTRTYIWYVYVYSERSWMIISWKTRIEA